MTTDERLERLEQELARAKRVRRTANWLLCAMALGLVVAIWLGSCQGQEATVKELHANRFVLEDKNGKVRAVLGANKDGPGLALYDENRKRRAALCIDNGAPKLALLDENGKNRAALSVIEEGPGLVLWDGNGNVRAGLDLIGEGPGLVLYDENGKQRAQMGAGMTESPDGKKTIYPESSLRLFGPDGKMLWGAPR